MNILDLVFLIIVANASPILATFVMRDRFDYPVDASFKLFDGQRIFGKSKTIRGIVAAIGLTTGAAVIIGHPAICGLLVGAYAMLGDVVSSFLKRRMQLPSSSQALVLDQLPEALLPAMVLAPNIGLATGGVATVVIAFTLTAMVLSPILYTAGIRKQRY